MDTIRCPKCGAAQDADVVAMNRRTMRGFRRNGCEALGVQHVRQAKHTPRRYAAIRDEELVAL